MVTMFFRKKRPPSRFYPRKRSAECLRCRLRAAPLRSAECLRCRLHTPVFVNMVVNAVDENGAAAELSGAVTHTNINLQRGEWKGICRLCRGR